MYFLPAFAIPIILIDFYNLLYKNLFPSHYLSYSYYWQNNFHMIPENQIFLINTKLK